VIVGLFEKIRESIAPSGPELLRKGVMESHLPADVQMAILRTYEGTKITPPEVPAVIQRASQIRDLCFAAHRSEEAVGFIESKASAEVVGKMLLNRVADESDTVTLGTVGADGTMIVGESAQVEIVTTPPLGNRQRETSTDVINRRQRESRKVPGT
jgi:hypothetical protein